MLANLELSSAQFGAYLSLMVYIFYFQDVNVKNRPANTPQSGVEESYDFVIVGAGSAGCVLASRLTEIDEWNVLLIEAGEDENAVSDAPALSISLRRTRFDWNYTTVEQQYVCRDVGGNCRYPRGRVMGGSSSINFMIYVRGNRRDFDAWEEQGNPGWSYDNVLKYFVKLENMTLSPDLLNGTREDNELRGTSGPLTVQYCRFIYSVTGLLVQAAKQLGYVLGDYNGVHQERLGYTQNTVNGPSRESASKAYLNPIRRRKNFHVIKTSVVSKLLFNGSHSVAGVEYIRGGKAYQVMAKKEVILSAGAINTPKILLLSGIGPQAELESLNIPLIKNLSVGKNLQDHPLATVYISTNLSAQVTYSNFYTTDTALNYARYGQGPVTSSFAQLVWFKSYLNETSPNAMTVAFAFPSPNNSTEGFALCSSVVNPESRGTVKLNSSDPLAHPLIDPNFLSVPRDKNIFRQALKDSLRFLKTPAMKKLNARVDPILNQQCAMYLEGSEEKLIDCFIANQSTTYYHPTSTARMGPVTNGEAVVNSRLLVHGFNNLRIVDASIMPNVTRGNTNAPTIMLAEKGADLIKETYLFHYL